MQHFLIDKYLCLEICAPCFVHFIKIFLQLFSLPGKGFESGILFSVLLNSIILLGCCTFFFKLVFIMFNMFVAVYCLRNFTNVS